MGILWVQFEKAIQDYNQAIELNPKDFNAFNNRGTAYAKLKQFEKASSATVVKSIEILWV
jgi:Flp pilus assembly protein TadD